MKGDRGTLYTEEQDFYALEGNIVTLLVPKAAEAVCRSATAHGLVVARIEGGFWLDPGFEARRDCIWDGVDPPISVEAAVANNEMAAEYIERHGKVHGAFVLTTAPLTGWPHKQRETP